MGPGGPKVAAFFDFDGTLIEGYSAGALYAHRARNFELGPDEFVRTLRAALGGPLDEAAFEDLLLQGIRGWVGRTEDDLMELGEQLFAQEIAGALFHGAWRLVRAHQNRGHTVVMATSATRMQAQPMARELGIDHVLCTELETEHGVLTGGLAGRTLVGGGQGRRGQGIRQTPTNLAEKQPRLCQWRRGCRAARRRRIPASRQPGAGPGPPRRRARMGRRAVPDQAKPIPSGGAGPDDGACSAASPRRWERARSPGR